MTHNRVTKVATQPRLGGADGFGSPIVKRACLSNDSDGDYVERVNVMGGRSGEAPAEPLVDVH